MNKQQQKFMQAQMEAEYNRQLQDIRHLELKARFWKAQFEIRHYTLQAEVLQVPYDEYVAAQTEKNKKAMQEYEEMLKKVSEEQMAKVDEHGNTIQNDEIPHVVTQEDLINNPELGEEGVVFGETIGIPVQDNIITAN